MDNPLKEFQQIEDIANHNSPGMYDVDVFIGKNHLTTISVQAKDGVEATTLAAKQFKLTVKKQWKI